jgi:hypothetical protein
MKEPLSLLQSAQARLRRIEARRRRYPDHPLLQRLYREACFRVEELEEYVQWLQERALGSEELATPTAAPLPNPRLGEGLTHAGR